jgi:hypothetical protein
VSRRRAARAPAGVTVDWHGFTRTVEPPRRVGQPVETVVVTMQRSGGVHLEAFESAEDATTFTRLTFRRTADGGYRCAGCWLCSEGFVAALVSAAALRAAQDAYALDDRVARLCRLSPRSLSRVAQLLRTRPRMAPRRPGRPA